MKEVMIICLVNGQWSENVASLCQGSFVIFHAKRLDFNNHEMEYLPRLVKTEQEMSGINTCIGFYANVKRTCEFLQT